MHDLVKQVRELWRSADGVPDINVWLSSAVSSFDCAELLAAVRWDQRRRWHSADPWVVEDYLQCGTELPAETDWRFELACTELRLRSEAGEKSALESLLSRFPDLEEKLQERWNKDEWTGAIPETMTISPFELEHEQIAVEGDSSDSLSTVHLRLERKLGEGTYGTVFLAYDAKLQRYVAVKIPSHKVFQNPQGARLFLQEARTVASLEHPGIVPIYDCGYDQSGAICVISRFVPGGTLQDLLQSGRLDQLQAAEMVAAIAEAVHYAHGRGILHRDLKPANILIEAGTSRPLVTDFGLATCQNESAAHAPLGTPAYMSPEQAAGTGELLDVRTDIFSLGVILYELLTGQRPFLGANAFEVMNALAKGDFVLPREVNPEVAPELERICVTALKSSPRDRFESADLLARDLRNWVASRHTDRIQTRRLKFALGAVILAAIVASVMLNVHSRQNRAEQLTAEVLRIEPASLTQLLPELRALHDEVRPGLQRLYAELDGESEGRFNVLLALLSLGEQPPDLLRNLSMAAVQCDPDELMQSAELLAPYADSLRESFADIMQDSGRSDQERLHAAALLASTPGKFASDATAALFGESDWKFIVQQLQSVRLDQTGSYVSVFAPAHEQLEPLLANAFEQADEGSLKRANLAWFISKYAADNLDLLCRLLLKADPAAHQLLLPQVAAHREKAITWFRNVLAEPLSVPVPAGGISSTVDSELLRSVETAGGILTSTFACCPHLPAEQLAEMLELLGEHGYRPVRIRTHSGIAAAGKNLAVIWTRDQLKWELRDGVKHSELVQENIVQSGRGLTMDDLTYLPGSGWMAIWSERMQENERRAFATEVAAKDFSLLADSMRQQGFHVIRLQFHDQPGVMETLSAIFSSGGPETEFQNGWAGQERLDRPQIDIAAGVPQAYVRELIVSQQRQQVHQSALAESRPENAQKDEERLARRFERGHILTMLGDGVAALSEFEHIHRLMKQNRTFLKAYFTALVYAGKLAMAAETLQVFNTQSPRKIDSARLGALLAATTGAFSRADGYLGEAIEAAGDDADLLVECALTAADAARLIQQQGDNEYVATLLDEAVDLLERAIKHGLMDLGMLYQDCRSDLLRADQRFSNLLEQHSQKNRFSGIWANDTGIETAILRSDNSADLLNQLRRNSLDRWQPSAITVAHRNQQVDYSVVVSRKTISAADRTAWETQRAAAATALLQLDDSEAVLPKLGDTEDPGWSAMLMNRVSSFRVPEDSFVKQLAVESSVSSLTAIIQAIGEFAAADTLDADVRAEIVPRLAQLFEHHQDPGVHGMCEWSLQQLGHQEIIEEICSRYSTGAPVGDRRWFLTKTRSGSGTRGLTMIVIPGHQEFTMGTPFFEKPNQVYENRHRRYVPRSFAIGMFEVTADQVSVFLQMRAQNINSQLTADQRQRAAVGMTLYQILEYCNWLSEQEGIARSEWAYPTDGEFASNMHLKGNYLDLPGYRLPTEAEWEYSCRAETQTPYFFGTTDRLLSQYAWDRGNTTQNLAMPVGLLRPNPWGLFDVYGNVAEWVADDAQEYPKGQQTVIDRDTVMDHSNNVSNGTARRVRGGSYQSPADELRSAARSLAFPAQPSRVLGFRVVLPLGRLQSLD